AMCERDAYGLRGRCSARHPTTKTKATFRTEAHGSDDRLGTKLRLVIAMPAHGILAVTVQIGEHAVEACLARTFHPLAQSKQRRRPRPGFETAARIHISGTGIA